MIEIDKINNTTIVKPLEQPSETDKKISIISRIAKPTSDKILSHIQADFYILDAPGQEGNVRENSFEAMFYHLNMLPSELITPALKQLIQEFELCHALIEKENEYKKNGGDSALATTQMILNDIESLEVGTRYLFVGGWDGKSIGHAIMHAIEKQENGKYTLMTFNTGAGLPSFHDYEVDKEGYRRYKPVIIIQDIEKVNLFNTSHLLSLIDLRHSPLSNRDAMYAPEIIYDSILPALGGILVPPSSDLIQVMRAQRSGTCTWKVLKALLKQTVDPNCYKAICIYFRLQNLNDYVNQKIEDKATLTDSQHLHLTNDIEKLIRELSKNNHGFSLETKEKWLAEIESIRQRVSLCSPKKINDFRLSPTARQKGTILSLDIRSLANPLEDLTVSRIEPGSRIPISLSTACPKKDKVLPYLEEWVHFCEKLYQNGQYNDIIFSVNGIIRNLPFPVERVRDQNTSDTFWGEYKSRTDKEISEIICLLTKLNELLFQSCFRIQKGHGDEIATTLATYCIQEKLLENLLNFERSFSGSCLIGLRHETRHEADTFHVEFAIEFNLLAHDPFLNQKAKECCQFLKNGWSFRAIIDLLLLRRMNNIHMLEGNVGNTNKLNALRLEVRKKAIEMGVTRGSIPEYKEISLETQLHSLIENAKELFKTEIEKLDGEIDHPLLYGLMNGDIGQFQILPDFLASLHKQIFITSYFLGNRDFTLRGPGSERPDAFTLATSSREKIAARSKELFYDHYNITPSIWIKGTDPKATCKTQSVSEMGEKAYKAIVNPDIQNIVGEIVLSRRWGSFNNPNYALTNYTKYKNLSPEEAQELITLIHTPSNLIIWQTISLFSRSIDKFQSRDYQILFELVVFPSLEEEIKTNPEFAKQFMGFLRSGIEEFRAPSQVDAFLFLIRVGIHFERLVGQKSPWLELLRTRLESSQDEQEKQAIEAQIAYTLVVTSSPEVSLENTREILLGLSHIQTGQVPLSMMELKIIRPVIEWLHKHEEEIASLDAQVLCSAVVQDEKIKWKAAFPLHESVCGEYRVNILTGEAFVQNSSLGILPRDILENPTFSNLFAKNDNRKVRVEGFRRFYFTENHREFRVEHLKDGNIAIEQKKEGHWFRYIPINFLPSNLHPTLREPYTHWASDDGEELLIQDTHFNHRFSATASGIHPYGELDKTLAEVEILEEFCFAKFEDFPFIQGWLDPSKKVCEVAIARYGLHFTGQSSGYTSREFPGYRVAKDQRLPQLPFISSYLILENEKGEKKTLIPIKTLVSKIDMKHFLKPLIKAETEGPFSYLIIELNGKGNPKHLNQHQAIYLAYLATAERNYVEADRFLTIAEGLSSIDIEGEVDRFCELVYSDNHPKAKALALRAGILVLNNMRYKYRASDPIAQKKIETLLKKLHTVYSTYHVADLNAGYLRVSAQSERKLLQEFFNQGLLSLEEFDRFLYLHHGKDLEPVQRKADGLEEGAHESMVKYLHESNEWNLFCNKLGKWVGSLDQEIWMGKKSLVDRPLTRPEHHFIPYFLEVCLNVEDYRKDPEKRAELAYYLRFIKWTESGIFFRECLLDIVNDAGQHYAKHLQELQELAKTAKSGHDISWWMNRLAGHFHNLYELKKTEKQIKKSFPGAPSIQLPQWTPPSSSLKPSNTEKPQPLWPPQQLDALFETVSSKIEEDLPDIDSSHLQRHQKHQVDLFNQNKTEFYQKTKPKNSYRLKDPKQFEINLTEAIDIGKKSLKAQKESLCSYANSAPQNPEALLQWKLECEGGLRRQLTMDDLIILYLRGSEKEILAHCPGFENKSHHCRTLLDGVKKYLEAAAEQQQRKRALKWVHELQLSLKKENNLDVEKEVENLNAELYSTLSATRQYDLSSHPELSIFEYRSNKLLRKDQVDILELFTNPNRSPAETEIIVQLIMGAGKTKVLLPLLASKIADGEKLSLMIVPSALYETNRPDLKQTSLNTSRQDPISFDFDRNTPFTEEELRTKLWSLQNAILYRNYVVTTPENLLCVYLKHKEILFQIGEGHLQLQDVEPQLKLLLEILQLIKTRGWAILDEADAIQDVRKEVNFPVGAYKTTPKERIRLVKKIYEVLLSQGMENWTHIRNNKPEAFSIKNFHENVAPVIVAQLIKDWIPGSIEVEDLEKFLLGKLNLKTEELPGLSEHPQRDLIALAKEMMTTFIPSVLSKKGNERFGLSQKTNTKYPIPYVANNTPDEASEFGNIYETLLYAANIYSQGALSDGHIDELIQETCRKIRLESKDLERPYSETPSFIKFATTYGIKDPFSITKTDRETLSTAIQKNQKALFLWLKHFVYPDIRYTQQKINANAMTLIDMLAHVQGFTGTPYNRPTYHERLQKPDREKELSSPKSELCILHAIYQKVKEGGIHTLSANTPKESLNKILKEFQFDCLIDVGALLNGMTNTAVAKEINAMAKKQDLSGTAYFNEKNELVIWLKGKDEPIHFSAKAYDRLISYYDQQHSSGIDIAQRPTAKALLTFSNNIIRDLTQGSMRMRKLLSSQNIEILLPAEIQDQIGKLTFDGLLLYAIVNQANRVADDLIHATKMKLHHIIRHELDQLIMSKENFETQVKLQKFFEALITDICSDDPYQEFGRCFTLEDTLTVLKNYRKEQVELISRLMTNEALEPFALPIQITLRKTGDAIVKKLNGFPMPSLELLAHKIPRINVGQMKNDTRVEVEKEVEMEVESEVKQLNNRSEDYLLWGDKYHALLSFDELFFTPDRTDSPKNCPLITAVNSLLPNGIFDKDLYTTQLFYKSVINQKDPLFGSGSQKHSYQLVFVVESDGTQRGIIVDPAEAATIRMYMSKDSVKQRKIYLVDLETNNIIEKRGILTDSEKEALAKLQVQTKFFNGELVYTKKEWEHLKQWIEGQNIKIVRETFEKIVSSYLGLAAKYQKSSLKKYLHQ